MDIQTLIAQPTVWITAMVVVIFGLWSAAGTLWRGLRLMAFVFIAYTIATQHLAFIIGLLNAFVPGTTWTTLPMAVLASTTGVLFISLSVLQHLLWQPDPVTTRAGWQRLVSGTAGASASWLLSVIAVLGIINATQPPFSTAADHNAYMITVQQSVALLNEAVWPLVP